MPQWWVYLLGEGKGWEKKTSPHPWGTTWLMTYSILWLIRPWKERIQWMNSSTWCLSFNILVSMDVFFGHKPWILTSTHSCLELMQICGWEMWWSQPYLQVARRSRPFHHFSYYPSVLHWTCYLEQLVQLTLEKTCQLKSLNQHRQKKIVPYPSFYK